MVAVAVRDEDEIRIGQRRRGNLRRIDIDDRAAGDYDFGGGVGDGAIDVEPADDAGERGRGRGGENKPGEEKPAGGWGNFKEKGNFATARSTAGP